MYDLKTGILNENNSTLYLYEGSEVELELKIKNDGTVSKKDLYFYGLGKKLYSKSFNDDSTIASEKVYHQDILGNNILLTDTTGGWVEKTTFGPFGDVISEKRRSPSSSIQHPTSYKFTGKERDRESNLDYFGARYLDYNNGRWMKPDVVKGSLFSPQTMNRYVYVENNPVNQIDVKGYSSTHLNTAGQSVKYDQSLMEIEIQEKPRKNSQKAGNGGFFNKLKNFLETGKWMSTEEREEIEGKVSGSFKEFLENTENITRDQVEKYYVHIPKDIESLFDEEGKMISGSEIIEKYKLEWEIYWDAGVRKGFFGGGTHMETNKKCIMIDPRGSGIEIQAGFLHEVYEYHLSQIMGVQEALFDQRAHNIAKKLEHFYKNEVE